MPFRVRRPSIKIGKTRIRFGKQGVSATTRAGAFSTTTGPRGTRRTIRLPGGISHVSGSGAPGRARRAGCLGCLVPILAMGVPILSILSILSALP